MKKKLLAVFLCCVMVFGLLPAAMTTAFAANTTYRVCLDGAPVETVLLNQNERQTLTVVPMTDDDTLPEPFTGTYQWQIHVDGEVWANIVDANGASLELSYALVASLLNGDEAQLRCRLTNEVGNTITTETVTVQVQPAAAPARAYAPAAPAISSDIDTLDITDDTTPVVTDADNTGDEVPNDETVPSEGETNDETGDTNDETPTTYTIIIDYVFSDGSTAAPSYTAKVAKGSAISQAVISPTVLGYTPRQATVQLDYTDIQEDKIITVYYDPAVVNFTVKHYFQNVDDDQYGESTTETMTGYTESSVGEGLAKDEEGFVALFYDTTTKIAADGSTVIEIYYDRQYFLLSFDLDGGYGVEPIYARYGTPINVDNSALKKAGYEFDHWEPALPASMPAEKTTHKAIWKAGDLAKVTIVVWGENADDEDYSYYKNGEFMAKPNEKLTLDDLQGKPICGKEEHAHSNACGIACTHTHTTDCYSVSGNFSSLKTTSKPSNTLTDAGNGIYTYTTSGFLGATTTHYYVLIGDTWYCAYGNYSGSQSDSQKISFNCSHKHDSACYACGKEEHTHSSACYYNTSFMDDASLWKLAKSDEVTVAADGTTIINVYYDRVEFTLHFRKKNSNSDNYGTIKAKWGANIRTQFSAKCTQAGSSNWSEKKNAKSPWTSYLEIMPTQDRTYYANTEGSGTSTAYYYVEGLDGSDVLYYTNTSTGQGYTVTEEEFIEIEGFTFDKNRSSKVKDNFDGAKFYYTRNSYELSFYNYNAEVAGKGGEVKFEAPLKSYDFVPDYPADLEPNAYVFGGWYTTAGCYEGSEADMNTMKMPASNLMLYAKWVPTMHTVRTYLTEDLMKADTGRTNEMQKWENVPHGTAVTNPPEDPTNGNWTFAGWFYMSDDPTPVEKAFDFSMPVTRDLNLYAKWSSKTPVTYTIKYVLQGTDTEIAPATNGSAMAATTKTFNAKAGNELNEAYRTGYFPTTNSHSMTFDIDGTNYFPFEYVQREKVKYTVRYLEYGTNEVLAPQKDDETSDAVITETFVQIKGYAPDAYQKRLVLSATESENVITFWYTKDEIHAPVTRIHYIQNLSGDGYTEYQSSTNINGVIGETYSETPLTTLTGFSYNASKSTASGELTAAGLVLKLYYDRIEYPYEFKFLEQGTDKVLAESVTGKARYQAQVTQTAKDIPGYTCVSGASQAIPSIAVEDGDMAVKNVKVFYYKENDVEIKYKAVGPTGTNFGSVSPENEIVKVINGTANGSTPAAENGFRFVGWFKDTACTQPVAPTWVTDNKIVPQKTEVLGKDANNNDILGFKAATYYAKFEYDVADLKISKMGWDSIDENQTFVFKVTGGGVDVEVTIQGSDSAIVKGLKVGTTYTVTEETDWSWRYEPTNNQTSQTVTLTPNAADGQPTSLVTFTNQRTFTKWLNGCAYAFNNWKTGNADKSTSN